MLLWGLAAASVVFWALRLATPAQPVPVGARVAINGPLSGADLSRLLGSPRVESGPEAAAAPTAASRFRLTGVVATSAKRSHDDRPAPGVALISIDGAPPKAYRVGDPLDSQFSLWSVALRSARIGDRAGGATTFILELPPPAAPATGSLAQIGAVAMPPPIGAPVPPPMMAPGSAQGAAPPPPAMPAPLPPPTSNPAAPQSYEIRGMPGNFELAEAAPSNRQGVPNAATPRQ